MGPKRKRPRILLVSGIFPPDVGGPAVHVEKIAGHLSSRSWSVVVVAFGEPSATPAPYRVFRVSRRLPKPVSWACFVLTVLRESLRSDVLYAFDLTTAGLPVALFGRVLRKPYVLRIGGDPIWERIVEYRKRFIPMRAYYEQGLFKKDKPFRHVLIGLVVRSAAIVVTYSAFLEGIYARFYGAEPAAMRIIPNPVPEVPRAPEESGTRTFLFAGRFVAYKNLERVVRVFASVAERHPNARLLLIGGGPDQPKLEAWVPRLSGALQMLPAMSHAALEECIASSSVALAPALTEFNPNFILEALGAGKPALISRDNGLSVALPEALQFDPLDDESLREAMERMMDPAQYAQALESVAAIDRSGSWATVLSEHEEIVASLLPNRPL